MFDNRLIYKEFSCVQEDRSCPHTPKFSLFSVNLHNVNTHFDARLNLWRKPKKQRPLTLPLFF